MRASDAVELVTLAALWGASFLFMRLGAGEFGPVALAALRVAGATLLLLPLLHWQRQTALLRRHWRPILLLGITNSVLPFLAFSYAALSITAGLSAVFNAATPLFGAAIAWLWLNNRPTPARLVGLLIGFAGVVGLASDNASFRPGGSGWAVAACLGAALCYGLSANLAKKRLAGVPPLAVAAGSQVAATLVLALPALLFWPTAAPSVGAWGAAALLAFACTGIAYLLYFRLIAHIGPTNAVTVTFLIPAFAVLWGSAVLDESVSTAMLVGCAVIVIGTGLATGLLAPRR